MSIPWTVERIYKEYLDKNAAEIMKYLKKRLRTDNEWPVEKIYERYPEFSVDEMKGLRAKMKEGCVLSLEEAVKYTTFADAYTLFNGMEVIRGEVKDDHQWSVESVCEWVSRFFADFDAKEVKALRESMRNGETFNPEQILTYLMYLDANNLYGWAMSLPLPTGGFRWLPDEELSITNLPPCFVKVDLSYPKEPHDKFAEYVPTPDNIIPDGSKVSKLAPNLLRKERYVCHVENLRLYEKLGVIVEKIYRALAFEESRFLAPYIEKNTKLRMQAKNKFEEEFFKLLNNAVFGKSCENLLKRVHVELANERKRALKLVAKPTYKHHTVYDETLVGIHMRLGKVFLDKPNYDGVTVLDLSKTLMYKFHYGYIKKKYGDNARLLCYEIVTKDFYKVDTYKYSKDHPSGIPTGKNYRVIGKFKDESDRKKLLECCGVRAKCYALKYPNKESKKCKGVMGSVRDKHISVKDCKNCIFTERKNT